MTLVWFYSIILFLFVIIATYLATRNILLQKISSELLLIFASSYLFALTILHLIPEIFENTDIKTASLLLLVGFLLQLFLDFFSGGIDHGHYFSSKGKKKKKYKIFVITLSLCIHAFFEASLLSETYHLHQNSNSKNVLLIGILLHKLPATLALVSLLKTSSTKKITLWSSSLLFALAAPLGLISITIWGKQLINLSYLYALICGMILHLALVIFFENNRGHEPKTRKIITILLAFLTLISTLYL